MVSESGGMMVALVVAVLMLETTKAAFIDKRPKMPRFPSFPSLSITPQGAFYTSIHPARQEAYGDFHSARHHFFHRVHDGQSLLFSLIHYYSHDNNRTRLIMIITFQGDMRPLHPGSEQGGRDGGVREAAAGRGHHACRFLLPGAR